VGTLAGDYFIFYLICKKIQNFREKKFTYSSKYSTIKVGIE
jgi:hypothetical protein